MSGFPLKVVGPEHDYVVRAWPVDITSHPEYTFAAHKSLTMFDEWVIAEVQTGMAVCSGDTYEEAVDKARIKLEDVSKEKMQQVIAKGHQMLQDRLSARAR